MDAVAAGLNGDGDERLGVEVGSQRVAFGADDRAARS